MAASLDELKTQIEAAERQVYVADAQATETARALKAHWRARAPTVLIGAGSALLAWQLLRGRRQRVRPSRAAYAAGSGALLHSLNTFLRYGGPRLFTALSAVLAGVAAKKARRPLASAPYVDLARYAGTWYEIARLPEKHERDCASDVTATYEPTADGGLRVINRCRRRDGSIKRAVGRAEVVDFDTNARLRVSFAPAVLGALPFVWAEYVVIDVASDYSVAMVGTTDRSHLWLLARQPEVSEQVRSDFITKALGQGFDTSDLIYASHTAAAADSAPADGGTAVPPATLHQAASAAAPAATTTLPSSTSVPPGAEGPDRVVSAVPGGEPRR